MKAPFKAARSFAQQLLVLKSSMPARVTRAAREASLESVPKRMSAKKQHDARRLIDGRRVDVQPRGEADAILEANNDTTRSGLRFSHVHAISAVAEFKWNMRSACEKPLGE